MSQLRTLVDVRVLFSKYVFYHSIADDCKWMLNLKGGSGKIEELTSSSSENVDTTISLNSENMKQLLMGKKNSTQLFMEGLSQMIITSNSPISRK